MELRNFFSVLLAIVVSLGLLYGLRPLARRIGLLDSPGARKTHHGDVPMIGGLAMFFGFAMAALTLDAGLTDLRPFFAASAVLVVVGVLDDLHELSSRARFAAQILAAAVMVGWGQVELQDLGAISFDGEVFALGIWVLPFSVFCTVGVINALNMIDGVDGLAGGVALVALCGLAWVADSAARYAQRDVLILLSACVLCFVAVNARTPWRQRASVFMGDAGSMFLGFAITWFFIDLSQGEARAMAPVTALWLLLVPLFDTVWLLFSRPLRGRWPTAASHDHVHHLLQRAGLSAAATTSLLWGVAALAAVAGLAAENLGIAETTMFYVFLGLFAVYAVVRLLLGTPHLVHEAASQSTALQPDDDRPGEDRPGEDRREEAAERRRIADRREQDRRTGRDRRGPIDSTKP